MHPQLSKVLELVKRTGDRCIVLDQSSDQAWVVMNLTEYEKLLAGQESGSGDGQTSLDLADLPSALSSLAPETPAIKEETLENEQFYFEPVEGN